MTFSHATRRAHLYLGLFLLPWFMMYAVSSVPFAHAAFFETRDAAKGLPAWTLRFERQVDVAAPDGDDPAALRAFGARLLAEAGIAGTAFGTYRQSPGQINVYSYSFWHSTQLRFFVKARMLRVEDRRFRWDHFLTGMHARGGFEQEGFLQNSWSVLVDVVCLAMLVWIASGLYMWWGVRGHRLWGWWTMAAGVLTFVFFAMAL
jgi:hypothetical protein